MKPKTKLVLYIIFVLGWPAEKTLRALQLISRAQVWPLQLAVLDEQRRPQDLSYRMISLVGSNERPSKTRPDRVLGQLIPTLMFGLFEEKLGIVVACLPAVRQLVVKIRREGKGALRSTVPTTTKHPGSTLDSGGRGSGRGSVLRGLKTVGGRKSQDTLGIHQQRLISAKPSTLRSREDSEPQKIDLMMQDWSHGAFVAGPQVIGPV